MGGFHIKRGWCGFPTAGVAENEVQWQQWFVMAGFPAPFPQQQPLPVPMNHQGLCIFKNSIRISLYRYTIIIIDATGSVDFWLSFLLLLCCFKAQTLQLQRYAFLITGISLQTKKAKDCFSYESWELSKAIPIVTMIYHFNPILGRKEGGREACFLVAVGRKLLSWGQYHENCCHVCGENPDFSTCAASIQALLRSFPDHQSKAYLRKTEGKPVAPWEVCKISLPFFGLWYWVIVWPWRSLTARRMLNVPAHTIGYHATI